MSHLFLNIVLQVSAVTIGTQDYKGAYEQAARTGQPLVVLVGADWCPGCQTMKQSVMPQLAKQGALTKVSFAIVNTDREQALAGQLMQGGSIPQLVMYRKTAAGWQRQQLTGAQSVGATASFLSQPAARQANESTARNASRTN